MTPFNAPIATGGFWLYAAQGPGNENTLFVGAFASPKSAYREIPLHPIAYGNMGPVFSSKNPPDLDCRPYPASCSRDSTAVQDGCDLSQGFSSIGLYLMNHWEQIGGTLGSFHFAYCNARPCALKGPGTNL
jgi:hypothetical protein